MAERAGPAIDSAWLEELERREKDRRARWSPAAWRQIVERSLPPLAASLADLEAAEANSLLGAYLALVAEAIALQTLFPHPPGVHPNIYSAVFEHLVPNKLGTVAGAAPRSEALAKLWNLCEGVSRETSWVEASMTESLLSLDTLADLSETCRAFQRDLVAPRPLLVSAETSPDALSYQPVTLWPVGFFLPKSVVRCGPNVLFVAGESPGIARLFYVLLRNVARVIPIGGAVPPDLDGAVIDEKWVSKLLGRAAHFQLPLRSCAVAESAVAGVYSGSQLLHVWRVEE